MAIATTLREFLDQKGARYDLVAHPHSSSSLRSAETAHIPGEQLAKAVVLSDEDEHLVFVLPATYRVEIGALSKNTHRRLGLAIERELAELFTDCEMGAVPALGNAYGLETIVDTALLEQSNVYFECGDHEELVHMSGTQFAGLLEGAKAYRCSHHF